MPTEFELIEQFFTAHTKQRRDVLLGIGDDCALLQAPTGQLLAVSTDTLIAGVHFPINTAPYDIGYKALAVNLSDLAAMGAEPAWITLALTMPQVDIAWLTAFRQGFFELIDRYGLQLIGGDTTRGPLSISVQVHGFVPENKALRRSGAQVGDRIYVSGTLGDAGLALQLLMKDAAVGATGGRPSRKTQTVAASDGISRRLHHPEPRINLGLALRGIATSAIDISDGLAADLGHILKASKVGASVLVEDLPLSSELKERLTQEQAWQLALSGGDDYELCFTVPAERESKLITALKSLDCAYTCIGRIEVEPGLRLQHRNGTAFPLSVDGYRHF